VADLRESLRDIISERAAVLAPGVYDGLSAHLTVQASFRVAYISGAAVSVATYGLPEIGLVTQTEMAGQVRLIASILDMPLVADADTGFGDATNTYRTVQLYEQAGASAIQLEDQVFPKRCGHLQAKAVIGADEFVEKIRAAVEARRDPSTVIIARTDALASLGFDEAVRRANLCADAGADLLFVEAPESVEQIKAIPGEVAAPTVYLVPKGRSPEVALDDLAEYGYAMTIFPGLSISNAALAIRETLRLATSGNLDLSGFSSPRSRYELVGLGFWEGICSRIVEHSVGGRA
jgi:2-methylisocitrate lyase-like PEP mutase family enzyme